MTSSGEKSVLNVATWSTPELIEAQKFLQAEIAKYAPEPEDFSAEWIPNPDEGPGRECPGCQDAADGSPYTNPYNVPDPTEVCYSMNGIGRADSECTCTIAINDGDDEVDAVDFDPTDYDVEKSLKPELAKGDVPGHEFHGNQYSGSFGTHEALTTHLKAEHGTPKKFKTFERAIQVHESHHRREIVEHTHTLTKGESEGHPFRGNRFTGGISGEGHEYIRDINNREKYPLEMAHEEHGLKTMDEIAQHPNYPQYEKAIKAWISDKHHAEGAATMKDSIRSGQPTEEAKTLLSAIAASENNAPALYRGMSANWKPATVESRFGVGKQFDLDLGSFTKDAGIARRFADSGGRWAGKGSGHAHIQFNLEPGARAANVNQVQWRIGSKADELEWLTSGRFEVTSFSHQAPQFDHPNADHRYYIGIKQVDTFKPKAAVPEEWDIKMLDDLFSGRQVESFIKKRADPIQSTINALRPLPKERAVVINARGQKVWEKDGGHDFVALRELEHKDIEGATFLHNHPSGVALSVDDIGSACALRLSRVYAIGKTGYTYCVEPPKGKKTFDPSMWKKIRDTGKAADEATRAAFSFHLKKGSLESKDANIDHWHTVLQTIAAVTGIQYSRVGKGTFKLGEIKAAHHSHIPVYDKSGVSKGYPDSKALTQEADTTFRLLNQRQKEGTKPAKRITNADADTRR